ncbi:MAG: IscS subfamily cysteine desulfurase [Pseudohongiellaceae bacterium]
MQLPVYLDYAATTPVDPAVAEAMSRHQGMDGVFGNPASRSHLYGWQAEEAVEMARRDVADLLHCDPREIVWTSGATEADNLAIKGVAGLHAERGRHIITSRVEHKAVLDPCEYLETRGWEVTWLTPDAHGRIDPQTVADALRPDTVLVSLMAVNNEVGVCNDIDAIAALLHDHQAVFHVDAAQAAGKMALDLSRQPVDLMSLSAHKVYGPKGIGALFVRREPRVGLEAQIHGGGHERGMRSGTLPTHQIVGMGTAFRIAGERLEQEREALWTLRGRLLEGLAPLSGCHLNGHEYETVPGIVNVAFEGVDGESLLMALRGLALSSGSACTSATLEPSYVLRAMGLEDELAQGSLRLSMGRFTTADDVDTAVRLLRETVSTLRGASSKSRVNQPV